MKLVVSLFDLTGAALKPWYDAGYQVLQIDLQLPEGLNEISRNWYCYGGNCTLAIEIIERVKAIHGAEVVFISCFPPCTDLAVSGSRWFASKRTKNPRFQIDAMGLVLMSRDVIEYYDVPGYIENPVSVISSMWRKPDYKFHPWHFTGYCIENNYTKKTCLWTSPKFKMPDSNIHPTVQKAVDMVIFVTGKFIPKPDALNIFVKRGLEDHEFLEKWYPDDRIHKAGPGVERANFRSATPIGFSVAVAEVNK